MEYMSGEMVRLGFGFANPNHAAAAICALFPFCWGWRGGWRWAGRIAGVALCAMLAMTYSRTGFVVLVLEAAVLWWRGALGAAHPTSVRGRRWNAVPTLSVALAVLAVAAWWMWPRLVLDGAILNRPKIWLAGLQLFAANPMGMGFGSSGEIATAFMLPDGITVRTLVNSHLTLLAEMGAFVGGAWLAFIALALCVGRTMRRKWVAFAGLALSAFSASVFDWHVLFDFKEMVGFGLVNFVLAWWLFVAFVGIGAEMVVAGLKGYLTQRCRETECAESLGRMVVGKVILPIAGVVVGICAVVWGFCSDVTPRVDGDFAVVGKGDTTVYRGEGWEIRSVREFFPDGARYCLAAGVPDGAADEGEVWLFGDAAEAAWRFPAARLTLVSPPEFCEVPSNAKEIRWQ